MCKFIFSAAEMDGWIFGLRKKTWWVVMNNPGFVFMMMFLIELIKSLFRRHGTCITWRGAPVSHHGYQVKTSECNQPDQLLTTLDLNHYQGVGSTP